MLKTVIALIFTCTLAVSNSVIAADCGNAENNLAIVDCHVARYQAADKELNLVYNKTMQSVSDSEKEKLKTAQKSWLVYRDASFELIKEINKDSGSYGNIVIADYQATLVEKRVLELKYLFSSPADPPVAW